jgi:hypothetical protein
MYLQQYDTNAREVGFTSSVYHAAHKELLFDSWILNILLSLDATVWFK